MCDELCGEDIESLPLPKDWTDTVRHAVLNVVCIVRMAIQELRAMHGWSKAETARHFCVTDDTIRSWLRRADDDSLLNMETPVSRGSFLALLDGIRPLQDAAGIRGCNGGLGPYY